MTYKKTALFVLVILALDQAFKLVIKANMNLGEEIAVLGDWFRLHFTENRGIAFGFEFGGRTGKFLLTLFRLVASGFIGYFLYYLVKNQARSGVILSIGLILAGALGNIVDSVFYGLIFGYESLFHGRVVDMLYFPLFKGYLPEWVPIWGGDFFVFFRPVFNIADSAITIGVITILLFYRNVFDEI